ncbi:MAG: hypothetical protein UHS49_00630 [Faecalimonas sp.]|nr:hypothetical protein [Faecalimonas sp.]
MGHIVEEWKVVEEASATKEGLKEGTCKVCSAELTVNIGKDITKVEQKDTTGTVVAKVEAVGDTVLNENVTLDAGNVTETLDAQTKAELDKKKDDFFGTSKKVTLISTWDISLVLRESATDGSEIKPLKYEPNGKIKVTIEVPANLLAKHKDVQLLHFLDNGTVESVNFVLDGTKVTFETDSLGYFAFAGTQIETETENTTSPKTADTSNVVMWIMLACVASVVCAGAVGVQKKRKYN